MQAVKHVTGKAAMPKYDVPSIPVSDWCFVVVFFLRTTTSWRKFLNRGQPQKKQLSTAKWSSLPHNLQLFKRVVVQSKKLTLELSPLILESPQSPNYRLAKLVTDHNTLILHIGSWLTTVPHSQMSRLPGRAVWRAAARPCVRLWPPTRRVAI